MLFQNQSGFRSGFSTDTCLIGLTDYVRGEIARGKLVGMVLIDLQKAFDTVDHGLLLTKLRKMGIGCTDWFRSYLTGRRQCVNVSGLDSDFLEVTCGVPQGSILGPTLFLCYVNDLSLSLGCQLSLYADDSALVASGKSVEDLSSCLTRELDSCRGWLLDNKLSLHLGKTESILFGTKRRLRSAGDFLVTCGGTAVNRVLSVKYLGVILDESLDAKEHVSTLIGRVTSRIGFLYRNVSLLDQDSRKTLCQALIQPYFDYCCASWYNGLSKLLKDKLDVLQRRMVRYVLGVDSRSHVGLNELKQLGWLSVPNRVQYFALVHSFRIARGTAPGYLQSNFGFVSDVHSHQTRGSQVNFFIPASDALGAMNKSFSFNAKKEWNALPSSLKSLPNEVNFKRQLKLFLSGTY